MSLARLANHYSEPKHLTLIYFRMQRAKTVKRVKTIINSVGAPPPPQTQAPVQQPLDFLQNMEKGMEAFFSIENKNTLKKPWIKLDRALKIDRLKAFAEAYDATAEEKQRLTQCLLVSLDRGLLKTRQIVIYNTETCKIDEIKGLTLTTSDAGLRTFKVEIPRATKRRTRTAQTQETGENPQEK